jgi:S1-C subfamily serine protease
MPELIHLIAHFLYDQPAADAVPVAKIYEVLAGHDQVEIGVVLHRMRDAHLLEATFTNNAVRLSAIGRDAWNDGSIVEQTIGMKYVGERYAPATVHIIVRDANGEHGGSGFFSADYGGWIVTAAHVVNEREIVKVLDRQGHELAQPPFKTLQPPGPDMALIKCACPEGINPIRIEWRQDAIQPMDRLLVLGYPPLPNLQAGLDHISAELRQVTRDFRGDRESLVISSVTLPGSSGGPVLSHRGRAVGIVEQENIGEHQGKSPIHAFTATPARYIRELEKLLPAKVID